MKRTAVVTGGLTGAVLLIMFLFGVTLARSKTQVTVVPEVAPSVHYTLQTKLVEGRQVFVGVGGEIDGVVNPTLRAYAGEVVQLTLLGDDEEQHNVALPDFAAKSEPSTDDDANSVVVFRADHKGSFAYFCTGPGHRATGMVGRFIVS